jgi:oxalate decarboxylase/phosphoglucose isomerase-like protein (cupin superfamily)
MRPVPWVMRKWCRNGVWRWHKRQGVVDLPSGQGHSRHNHPGSEEIIFVIFGDGEQMVEDEAGTPIVQVVGPGCTVYVPDGRYH